IIPVLARKGALRASVPANLVLLGSELLAPFRVRLLNFLHLDHSFSLTCIREIDDLHQLGSLGAPERRRDRKARERESNTRRNAETCLQEGSPSHIYMVIREAAWNSYSRSARVNLLLI